MASGVPIPDKSFLHRTAKAVQAFERGKRKESGPTFDNWASNLPFFVQVDDCDDDTGFAACREVNTFAFHATYHYPTGTVITDAQTIYALNGPLNWYEAGDIALCMPCRGAMSDGTIIRFVLVPVWCGLNYNATPTEDSEDISATQDSPGVHDRCTDTVEP